MTEKELLDVSKQLISVASTTDNKPALDAALSVVERLLRESKNITIERFEQNGKPSLLAYVSEKRPEKFEIILNGHVDVVPGQPHQFKPYVVDGKLFGRGALDMKVAALVMTDVFCRLAPGLPHGLGLQIVTDEEVGGRNGTLHQIEQGVGASFVVAGEFTKPFSICVESRGICWARIRLKGKAAHSAYLWEGENALVVAQEYINKLLKVYPVPHEDVWCTTANVANVYTSNTTLNRVPDDAVVELDIRYISEDTHFSSASRAKKFLEELMPGAEVELLQYEPCHKASRKDKHVQALAKSLAATTEKPVTFIRKHGAADIRFYSARGVSAVAFGLQGEGLHGDEEFAYLESIARYRQTLDHFLRSLCS